MPANSKPPSAGFGTVQFTLKVQNTNLSVRAQLPEGQVSPTVLLPILGDLSNSLCDLTIQSADQSGQKLSCREGCGACCRQAVPITPVEARAIADWLDRQPEDRQVVLHDRFRSAAARLEESGLARQLREHTDFSNRSAMQESGLKYFALGIACPFLEQERCTIHAIRPLRCREYLVVSPAEFCAHPETKEVVGLKPPVMLSQILAKWDMNGDLQPPELILLTMLDEWIARHPPDQDRPKRTAPELLQEFLHVFARDRAEAPEVPRGQTARPDEG